MRVYFEKPQTTTGWKGLINDPHLDNSGDVNAGLRIARRLLLQGLDLGLPIGARVGDPASRNDTRPRGAPAGGDAGLLREAADDDRLEGPDQRPPPGQLR